MCIISSIAAARLDRGGRSGNATDGDVEPAACLGMKQTSSKKPSCRPSTMVLTAWRAVASSSISVVLKDTQGGTEEAEDVVTTCCCRAGGGGDGVGGSAHEEDSDDDNEESKDEESEDARFVFFVWV